MGGRARWELNKKPVRKTTDFIDARAEGANDHAYFVRTVVDGGEGEPSAVRVNAVEWVAPEELRQYSFPGADQKTVDLLLKGE